MDKQSVLLNLTKYLATANASSLSFKNIPIRYIMGEEFYNKFNKFKLVLNLNASILYNSSAWNKQYFLRISGLDWCNISQYVASAQNNKTPLIPLPLNTCNNITFSQYSTMNFNQFSANVGFVFNRPTLSTIDMTISIVDTNLTVVPFDVGFNMFIFSIYGIEDD